MTDRHARQTLHQVRRLEEAVQTLREELSDANEELLASRKLFDEQRGLLLRELDRERLLREQMQREVARFKGLYEAQLVRPATSTVGTSTIPQMEVGVATEQSFPVTHYVDFVDEEQGQDEDEGMRGQWARNPSSSSSLHAALPRQRAQTSSKTGRNLSMVGWHGPEPVASPWGNPQQPQQAAKQQQFVVSPSPRTNREGPMMMTPRNLAVTRFADWLCRSTGYFRKDLGQLFVEMGANSVMEICAHLTVEDLVQFGVPVVKARHMMHCVAQHGQRLLYD